MKIVLLLLLLIILMAVNQGMAAGSDRGQPPIGPTSTLSSQPISWVENGQRHQAWLALDEVAVFAGQDQAGLTAAQAAWPGATVTEANEFVTFLRLTAPVAQAGLEETVKNQKAVSPVFYRSLDRNRASRLVLTNELIVQFPAGYGEARILAVEKDQGLVRLKSFSFAPNTFLYQSADPFQALAGANSLSESGQVNYAYPNWLRTRFPRSGRATPNDPYFPDQWHLYNVGQGNGTPGVDINVVPAWDKIKGSRNEVIAIVDEDLEIDHEDLKPNVLAGASWNFQTGTTDPTGESYNRHGTHCAGLAAGRGDNNIGITGVAPQAALVGYRLLGAETDANEAEALTKNNGVVDIFSNSWGPADDGQRLEGPGPLTLGALAGGVTLGRGGLGSIYTWAGGNGYDYGDNANYDGYANSRYVLAVAASTNQGVQSYYSEEGANILVNAPSSGGTLRITTTDRTGTLGSNTNPAPDGNYTSIFGGTSAACPQIAGVAALLLQANPKLTWRDVRAILAKTAVKNDPTEADWTTNGAGYHINHKYGFGIVETSAAVDLALTWTNLGQEISFQAQSSPNLAIPDNNAIGVTGSVNITGNIKIEFIEVYFSASDHPAWGDLEITLTSPAGTKSVLARTHNGGTSAHYDSWRFGTVRHFEESSLGTWTLTVKDLTATNQGTFQSWKIIVYGTAMPVSSPGGTSGGCFIPTVLGE